MDNYAVFNVVRDVVKPHKDTPRHIIADIALMLEANGIVCGAIRGCGYGMRFVCAAGKSRVAVGIMPPVLLEDDESCRLACYVYVPWWWAVFARGSRTEGEDLRYVVSLVRTGLDRDHRIKGISWMTEEECRRGKQRT